MSINLEFAFMSKRFILLLTFTFLNYLSLFGQTCECPISQIFQKVEKADTTFYLSNGKIIVLCGYKNPESHPSTFSEFVLSVCGQDTVIDFWSAVLTCRLQVDKDTLIIDQLENLPTGKNFKFQETIWTTEKIYFSNEVLIRNLSTNEKIQKYSNQEIQQVLTEFESTKEGYEEEKMEIVYKLFIAAISGSETAKRYFYEFDNKFWTLDGGDWESYLDLTEMLQLWYTNE